jgi:polyphenol oxidase
MLPRALRSRILEQAGFRHAFFTRAGGVSEGPYASLNFAASAGDVPERVAANRALAEQALGVEPGALRFLSQVHGARVVAVSGAVDFATTVREEGDAVISGDPSVALGVRSADCATLLFGDPESGIVAAAHAGWRGTVLGVVEATLDALEARGVDRRRVLCSVGPMIERCCFEVGEDVAATIAACSSARDVIHAALPRPRVDLRAVIHAKLADGGITKREDVGGCTACNPDVFFSYRRDGRESGRLLSAIVPAG